MLENYHQCMKPKVAALICVYWQGASPCCQNTIAWQGRLLHPHCIFFLFNHLVEQSKTQCVYLASISMQKSLGLCSLSELQLCFHGWSIWWHRRMLVWYTRRCHVCAVSWWTIRSKNKADIWNFDFALNSIVLSGTLSLKWINEYNKLKMGWFLSTWTNCESESVWFYSRNQFWAYHFIL